MLSPEYLAALPDSLVERYAQLESDILEDMARKIGAYNTFNITQYQMKKLEDMGMLQKEIIKKLSRLLRKTEQELKDMITEAGIKALEADDRIYEKAGLSPVPLEASPVIQETLAAGLVKTKGLFENLTATTANTATKQFERALDRAYMQATTGAFSYFDAIRMAIKDLSRQGLGAIEYPSGRIENIEVAVRRAVVTGANQTAIQMQIARADEMDCDLVETTAHSGARPSHAVWQGRIFSRTGKSEKYPDFTSSTGYGTGAGLGGWNCRHSFYPYIEGAPRAYTPEMLKQYNEKSISYNGQKMTEYEASQQQRYIERQIRHWKREYKAMDVAAQDTGEAAAKLAKWQQAQKDFLRQTGLKRQGEREQIPGFGRSEAAKARAKKEFERQEYLKNVKPKQPKVIDAKNINLQHKLDYEIIGKDGEKKRGIIPKSVELTNVHVIGGYETSVTVRVAKDLVQKYGGEDWKWQKKTGTVISEYREYEIHWYEYNGQQYSGKLKRWKEK